MPTSWTNYLGVKDMCAVLNHTAGGYIFYKSPEYHRITRFRANAVPMDRPGHYVYIRDDEDRDYWSVSCSRWENYKTAFDRLNIFTAYKNSIIVSCCVAVVVILLAGMASYALATAGIFSFLWSCNDLFSQTFFLRFKDQWAITRLLMEISSREGTDYASWQQ